MGRLIISALAVSPTMHAPEKAYLHLSVADAETGEPIYDLPVTDIEIWDASERAQISRYHAHKSGLYTLFAEWPDRAVIKMKVYGLLVKIKRSRQPATDVIWDYGQVIVPLHINPDM